MVVASGACGGPTTPAESLHQGLTFPAPDPARTVTIQVHGFDLKGASDDGNVGDDRGGGDVTDGIGRFSGLPQGASDPAAPNQLTATEYYGDTFPAYYSPADIAQVSAQKGVPRYALIVGKYARMVLARTGADGINLSCHSMGCLISRYLIENDVEKLVSDGKVKRWVSFAGVVNGAKLADLDKGKWIDPLASLFGFNLVDVEDMGYDWVTSNVAVYDHVRTEGNNPNFAGILVHHIMSDKPKIDTAATVPLMDLFGYGNVPNDGIVLDDEMYLHNQQSGARWVTPSGELLLPSRSHHYADHFTVTDIASTQALAAAALVGSRRVRVTLSNLTLIKDHESIFLDKPPAEVAVESTVQYPYVAATEPSNPLLDEVTMARRNAPVIILNKGETKTPNLVLFEGPVFDAQTSVALNVKLSETDYYPAGGVNENALSPAAPLGSFVQEVPLENGDYTVATPDANFTVHVAVVKLY